MAWGLRLPRWIQLPFPATFGVPKNNWFYGDRTMKISDQSLLDIAREASTRAYVPYSGFAVGAALSTAGGKIFAGCNLENASFGLTICAERVALDNAVVRIQGFFQIGGGSELFAAPHALWGLPAGTMGICTPDRNYYRQPSK